MTKLTELQKITILNIARNIMNSANGGIPRTRDETLCWTDQIISDGKIYMAPTSLPGCMASLVKRGLINTGLNGTDLTDAGFAVYQDTVEPWYQARCAAKK